MTTTTHGYRHGLSNQEESSMSRIARRVALLVAVAVIGACGGTAEDAPSLDPPADDVVLRVIVGDAVTADWTLEALEASVPFVEMDIDGDTQNGPRLLEVLEASGVEDWDTAQVIGMGEGRTFEVGLDITAAETDESWILDVTNRGTLKLAAEGLSRQQWVRDVGEIRIP
jgi:hypothetical protein